jgi:Family of unknown function (DUF6031)
MTMNPTTPGPLTQDRLFPTVRAGRGLPAAGSVRAWATAAWLLAVEGRAYLEDLDGGRNPAALRQVVRMRLLELLLDVDDRLSGRAPVAEPHSLALALEYGLHTVAEIDGAELVVLFGLDREYGAPDDGPDDGQVHRLWEQLCEAFPGELPDPLQPSGQREVLRALRMWSTLCTAADIDAGFLEPFLKDA